MLSSERPIESTFLQVCKQTTTEKLFWKAAQQPSRRTPCSHCGPQRGKREKLFEPEEIFILKYKVRARVSSISAQEIGDFLFVGNG